MIKNVQENNLYSKLYIAVLDTVPDNMVPTLVAHSILGAHLKFYSETSCLVDPLISELLNNGYYEWLSDSFRKCVVRVNRKEFEKIKQLTKVYLGHENTTLNGEKSCAVVYPVMSNAIPNVLQYAKLWKPKNNTIIYFDMDGVLADFEFWYNRRAYHDGSYPDLKTLNTLSEEERLEVKEQMFTYDFFRLMPPIQKGLELLKYYQKNYDNVVILSAIGKTSRHLEIEQAKREWLKEHVGDITAYFVNKTENKFDITHLYPSYTNHILVDDREKSLDPWIKKGGIGIKYV